MIWAFSLQGRPMPWKRAQSRGGQRFTDPAQRRYQSALATMAIATRPAGWKNDASFSVLLVVTPKDKIRTDLDNFAKQVGDALNDVVWADDSQIDEWRIVREGPSPTKCGIRVVVETREAS
jgi:Holliday junction resolvase RusA-like endonuclease